MGAKAVIRDAARALDMPYAEADKIAKLIPTTLNITLEDALKQSAELAQLQKIRCSALPTCCRWRRTWKASFATPRRTRRAW